MIALPVPRRHRDLVVELRQVRAVTHGNQCALHQRRPSQFRAAFGDSARAFGFVAVANPGDNAEVGGQFAGVERSRRCRRSPITALVAPRSPMPLMLRGSRWPGSFAPSVLMAFSNSAMLWFRARIWPTITRSSVSTIASNFIPSTSSSAASPLARLSFRRLIPCAERMLFTLFFKAVRCLTKRVAGLRQARQLGVQLVLHSHLRQHFFRQVKGQRPARRADRSSSPTGGSA